MSRNLEMEFDSVKEDLSKLRSDISSLTSTLQDVASEKMRSKFSGAQEKFDIWSQRARETSRERLEDIADEIEDRPLTSLLVVFGIGVVIGRLLDR
jgi:ElaB/YqjD/DUF883 family membrane-anchored ribosome-binding protein